MYVGMERRLVKHVRVGWMFQRWLVRGYVCVCGDVGVEFEEAWLGILLVFCLRRRTRFY